jgi:hypothetical protein
MELTGIPQSTLLRLLRQLVLPDFFSVMAKGTGWVTSCCAWRIKSPPFDALRQAARPSIRRLSQGSIGVSALMCSTGPTLDCVLKWFMIQFGNPAACSHVYSATHV